MSVTFINTAVVVAARQFNPSVLNPMWLAQNGLISQATLGEEYVFTPAFAQVNTPEFAFNLLPERLQFIPNAVGDRAAEIVLEKVGAFVRAVPHTPYVALGLNFDVRLDPDGIGFGQFARSAFFVPSSPLHQEFDTADARFGGYLSKNVLGCRMKLDAKPVLGALPGEEPHESLILNFNFHHDLQPGPEAAESIVSALKKWNDARDMAERIAHSVCKKDKP